MTSYPTKTTALRAARTGKDWSQREAADKFGLDPGNYHRVEQGELNVSREMAARISNLLGMPLDSLFRPVPARYTAIDAEEQLEAKAS